MTPAELSRTVLATVRRAVEAGELDVPALPERAVVQRPPRPGCGDYATNVALQLAGPAGRSPYEVAAVLARRLEKEPGIAGVEIAGAGFLNITLDACAYGDVVRQVRQQRGGYGHGDGLADEALTVTGDTGPRAAVVAEAVNALLHAAGARPGPPQPVTVAEPPLPAAEPPFPAADSPLPPAAPPLPSADPALPVTAPPLPSAEPPLQDTTPAAPPAPGALGPDATRWAYLRPPAEDVPRLTPDLLVQREANPLFRVRYAHARTRALQRHAHDLGIDVEQPAQDPYHHPAETELLGLIADFPRVVETAARRHAPDRVARHLERLADAFLRFQQECPPLPKGDEKPSAAHAARLRLADATGVVLAGGLHLLGITAPDHL
ncbi:DALR anticodon-binding domain-containing protein [Actinacidiphila sp. DG2A-62]|uniref:ArgS-related anticodon-binding protein NrtL n=1 Tax=Actinacidiphila sp. DG2A-62 TaxID=3108821 RepID=UPI002DB8B69F|nr:DALR anticodon-binding domain-containing protein [Actinacidiphila sp. DG2A-62]MEC3997233.1 DALR anticodon-binding domain-containing protein [Actinacidiphila sp. DG2A-62]